MTAVTTTDTTGTLSYGGDAPGMTTARAYAADAIRQIQRHCAHTGTVIIVATVGHRSALLTLDPATPVLPRQVLINALTVFSAVHGPTRRATPTPPPE